MSAVRGTAVLVLAGVAGAIVWLLSGLWWPGALVSLSVGTLGYWLVDRHERHRAERDAVAATQPDSRLIRH